MNSSNSTLKNCDIVLVSTNVVDIVLNAFRMIVLLLHLIWFLIAFRLKGFHNKSMIFLYNLNVVSLLKAIYGIHLSLLSECYEPSVSYCYFSLFFNLINISLPGYSICGLILYRLACIYYLDLKKRFNLRVILISMSILWGIPCSSALVNLFILNGNVFYVPLYLQCIYTARDGILSFYFNLISQFILPEMLVLFAYFSFLIKLKLKSHSSNTRESLQPPRITIMLVIYVITYQIGLLATVLQFLRFSYLQVQIEEQLFSLTHVLKWFQHFCPLGLIYFHSVMIKEYKRIFNYLKCC